MATTDNNNLNTPGLSSIPAAQTPGVDVTKIGSRKRTVTPAAKAPTKTPTTTTKTAVQTTQKPVAAHKPTTTAPTPATAKLTKEVEKKTPTQHTGSSFKVGTTNYHVIDDNSSARGMIKWDDKGNIAPDSPVQVIGKNASGGFVLAAQEATPGITKAKFPYSQDTGISFHSLESDAPGEKPAMEGIHQGSFTDLSGVVDPKAASQLRGIYKRTGQF